MDFKWTLNLWRSPLWKKGVMFCSGKLVGLLSFFPPQNFSQIVWEIIVLCHTLLSSKKNCSISRFCCWSIFNFEDVNNKIFLGWPEEKPRVTILSLENHKSDKVGSYGDFYDVFEWKIMLIFPLWAFMSSRHPVVARNHNFPLLRRRNSSGFTPTFAPIIPEKI